MKSPLFGCHAEIDMELATCLVCGVLFSELHLLRYVCASVSEDNEGCGMLLPVLQCAYPPVRINKARDCHLLD